MTVNPLEEHSGQFATSSSQNIKDDIFSPFYLWFILWNKETPQFHPGISTCLHGVARTDLGSQRLAHRRTDFKKYKQSRHFICFSYSIRVLLSHKERKFTLFFCGIICRQPSLLKVGSNEKRGGSGSKLLIDYGFGPWRFMSV